MAPKASTSTTVPHVNTLTTVDGVAVAPPLLVAQAVAPGVGGVGGGAAVVLRVAAVGEVAGRVAMLVGMLRAPCLALHPLLRLPDGAHVQALLAVVEAAIG